MAGLLQSAKDAMSGMMGGSSNQQQQQGSQQGGNVNDPNANSSMGASGDKYEAYIQKGEGAFKTEFGGNANAMRLEQGVESADKYRMMANGQAMGQGMGMQGSGAGSSVGQGGMQSESLQQGGMQTGGTAQQLTGGSQTQGASQGPTQGAVSGNMGTQDKVSSPMVPGSASNMGVQGTGGMSDSNDNAN